MYVQDAIMIHISLTEFSNVSRHFMEAVITRHKWISLSPTKLQSNLSVRTPL